MTHFSKFFIALYNLHYREIRDDYIRKSFHEKKINVGYENTHVTSVCGCVDGKVGGIFPVWHHTVYNKQQRWVLEI